MGAFNTQAIIVTGGANGIGRATAIEFAREGANVTIADVDGAASSSALSEMHELGNEGLFVEADVSQSSDCKRVIRDSVSRFGGVDILVNNAAVQPPASYVNVENTPEELWDRLQAVNLKSCFLMSKYAIPEMRKRGGGVIINTASVQGLQSMKLVPAYAASKGGVLSLTRQIALDYATENIRVLAVCPGTIDTPMVRAVASLQSDDVAKTVQEWGRTHPVGRVGTGTDIANVILFLASEKASFMTGEYICVDGGYMAQGAWAAGAGTDN